MEDTQQQPPNKKGVEWVNGRTVTIGLILVILAWNYDKLGNFTALFMVIGVPLVILFGIIFLIVWMVKSSSKIIK